MTRTRFAALLVAPALLAAAGPAAANHPKQCYGGHCLLKFQKIHQHGPLFNYGPYYGYPPFEPYGPWNAYLQYNPWYYGVPGGDGGRDRDRLGNLLRGLGHKDGCGLCDRLHAMWKDGGWFNGSGCLSCGKKGNHGGHGGGHGGCSPCGSADPVTRCSGVGDPSASAVFYAGLPSLAPTGVR